MHQRKTFGAFSAFTQLSCNTPTIEKILSVFSHILNIKLSAWCNRQIFIINLKQMRLMIIRKLDRAVFNHLFYYRTNVFALS